MNTFICLQFFQRVKKTSTERPAIQNTGNGFSLFTSASVCVSLVFLKKMIVLFELQNIQCIGRHFIEKHQFSLYSGNLVCWKWKHQDESIQM